MSISFATSDTRIKEIDLLLDLYIGIKKLQDYSREKKRFNEVNRCKEIISLLFSLLNRLTSINKNSKPKWFKAARVIDKIISELAYFHPDSKREGYVLISDNLDKYNYQ
ncbi:hypothetical protein [Emticicia fontis]